MKDKIKGIFTKVGYYTKPDFIIIGAQKAGTSALFSILHQHSQLKGASKKEIHFFDNDQWYANNKLSEYHANFPLPFQIPKGGKTFEATPMYIFHPEVAQRLHSYNPHLKLIVMLRNPAERAFSAWAMHHYMHKAGLEKHDSRTFSEAITNELENIDGEDNSTAYIKRGIYHSQIEAYLRYFPIEQMLFIESEDMKNTFDNKLSKILSFIEVPFENLDMQVVNERSINDRQKYIKDIEKLAAFYKPHNEKLFKLIGKEFHWNNTLP